MPQKVRNNRKRTSTARSPLMTELVGHAMISPAATVAFNWDNLPEVCRSSPFRLVSVKCEFAAVDTAVLNKVTAGPALVQIRQQEGAAQSSTSSGATVKTSPQFMIGPNPKNVFFRCNNYLYPSNFRGSGILAVDCICPNEGYEIGVLMSYSIRIHVFHATQPESCKLTQIPYQADLDSDFGM